MKKSLFFSSMLATLATAGSALMMSAAPVMADTELDSDLKLNVTAGTKLSLDEVPGYNFGTVSNDTLLSGITDGWAFANIDGQRALQVTNTKNAGWKLTAHVSQEFTSTDGNNIVLPAATLKLSNGYASETLTIKPGTEISSTEGTEVATGVVNGPMTAQAITPYGGLRMDGHDKAVAPGTAFNAVVDWTLTGDTLPADSL